MSGYGPPARRWRRAPTGRVVWLLGGRWVELLLPSGEQRSGQLREVWLPPGSRAVADPELPGTLPFGHRT